MEMEKENVERKWPLMQDTESVHLHVPAKREGERGLCDICIVIWCHLREEQEST